jgi:hypothetical protein
MLARRGYYETMIDELKKCKKCGEVKPISAFTFRTDSKTYRHDCKLCRKNMRSAYYEQNRGASLEQAKVWRANNYARWQEGRAEYYQNNKADFSRRNKDWVSKNKDKVAKWERDRRRQPYYKLRQAHRSLLRRTINGEKAPLGYTRDELRSHMENLFTEGMSWDNHGEWEIDHIKPVKAFWDEGVTDPKIVNALSNLQPLWKTDNRKKSSKWVDD